MFLSPFGKSAAHSAFVRDIKSRGEFADVMENQNAAGRERGRPEIELGDGGLIFVRAVHDDQLRIAAEIFLGCVD